LLPIVERYVERLKDTDAPPIKVADGVIIDGK